MDMRPRNIGIIAGSGQFPALVARAAKAAGTKVFICGFTGQTAEDLYTEADDFLLIPLGQLGRLLAFFKDRGVTDVCLAGAIKKSKVLDLRPDWRAAKLLFKVVQNQGDDAILRAVLEELQAEGLVIRQAADLLPDLLGPAGVLTRCRPDARHWASIKHGWPIGKTLGAHDIGQCLVLLKNMVVAVEALEGTDAVLERGALLAGRGCVALKMLKPGQERRADLPAIGLGTIQMLTKHAYSCLAYEAGNTLFFDRESGIALADAHGLAIVGIPPGDSLQPLLTQ